MRKIFFIALVGACITFPGKADATTVFSTSIEMVVEQGEISQELVERILRYVGQELGTSYECLCSQYAKGELTIEKDLNGYLVRDGGGLSILIMDEDF